MYPYYERNYQQTLFFFLILNILIIFPIILLYIRNPNINYILPKVQASKIAKKHLYGGMVFFPTIFFAYGLGLILRNYIPMPIPGFYGDIILLAGFIWVIYFRKDFIQFFDIIDIYLKDQLYPEIWPAQKRQNDREWQKGIDYKAWLAQHASPEEQQHYKELSEQNPDQARKFAVSRMDQIEAETGKKKLHL